MKTKTLLTTILIVSTMNLFCQIIHVPDDQPTIQAGINAATNGDTVLVDEGTWLENIRFKGKAITVASHFLIDGDEDHIDNTIIDGSQATNPDSASTVMFINFEDTTSIICGFTIQGGAGLVNPTWNLKYGGGIACWESGPIIRHNKIKDNMITDPSFNCGGIGIGSWSATGAFLIVIENNLISDNVGTANAESARGGGVYVMTNAIIRNNTIENNSIYNSGIQADGGGIEVEQPLGISISASIHNNIIQNNTVEGNESLGGGILIYNASATISNNEISNNSCIAEANVYGGGICTYFAGEMHISNNQVVNNTCVAASCLEGGYLCYNTNGELYITGNEFSNNEMTSIEYSFGAGIWIYEFSHSINIKDNYFHANIGNYISGWSMGGALGINGTSNEEVITENNIFSNHNVERGAAIWTFNLPNHKIQNNVFRDNSAEHWGGGLFLHQYYSKNMDEELPTLFKNEINARPIELSNLHPQIINNTFINNHAGELGGAIYTTGTYDSICPVILNNIFWNNTANIAGNDIRHGGDEDIYVGYNDIDTNSIWGNWTGEYNIYEDPIFIDDSCHIADSSQCIEAGVSSIEIFGEMYNCPDIDIDGQPRPLNGTADIGVDEVLITGIIPIFNKTVRQTSLEIYPNPFKTKTTIEFNIPQSGFITLSVVDFTGKNIQSLVSKQLPVGTHQIEWNAGGLPSGIYFLKLETNGISETRKLLLIK